MSEIIQTAYKNLPLELKEKYRSRFTQMLGELAVLDKLKNRRYNVELKSGQGSYDLEIIRDNKKIKVEVKACNTDNPWVKSKNFVPGATGINPDKFHHLIYVEFDDSFEKIDYYIFTKNEAENFPYTRQETSWFANKYKTSESRTINRPFSKEHFKDVSEEKINELNKIQNDSKDAWEKKV